MCLSPCDPRCLELSLPGAAMASQALAGRSAACRVKSGGFRKPACFCREGNVALIAATDIRDTRAGGSEKKPALGPDLGSG